MRILSILAQKPGSTGSGVYLTELLKVFAGEGHTQAVIAGICKDDVTDFPEGTDFYPVLFETKSLPFPVVGMSDEMPYPSTRYCDLTETMVRQFRETFTETVTRAVEEFRPDVILCHHLYLVTAIVRDLYPDLCIIGFCHNTDLRQMQKTDLERNYIAEQIRKLDGIFVLQQEQRRRVMEIYGAEDDRICEIGIGYNSHIFYPQKKEKDKNKEITSLVFAGKISEKKGVVSLLRSLRYLEDLSDQICLRLAGGAGNEEEYQKIRKLAGTCRAEVTFLGKLTQEELARVYRESDIFVLPSFYEGLPLTAVEALACGDRVVITDLPGVRDWMTKHVPGADIRYVKLPGMCNEDEPVMAQLPEFEQRLAETLRQSILCPMEQTVDVRGISWEGIGRKVLNQICEFAQKD